MQKNRYYRGIIASACGTISYNAALLRVVKIYSDEDKTVVVLEPCTVDEQSVDLLAQTVVEAKKRLTSINPEDYPKMVVRGAVRIVAGASDLPEVSAIPEVSDIPDTVTENCVVASEDAEPKDYTILGVKLKYDKNTDGYVTPDGKKHIKDTSHLAWCSPKKPQINDLYQYVLDYKVDMYTEKSQNERKQQEE